MRHWICSILLEILCQSTNRVSRREMHHRASIVLHLPPRNKALFRTCSLCVCLLWSKHWLFWKQFGFYLFPKTLFVLLIESAPLLMVELLLFLLTAVPKCLYAGIPRHLTFPLALGPAKLRARNFCQKFFLTGRCVFFKGGRRSLGLRKFGVVSLGVHLLSRKGVFDCALLFVALETTFRHR